MSISSARPVGAQAPLRGVLTFPQIALYAAAATLGTAAVVTGYEYGLERAGPLGALCGVAAALATAVAPSAVLTALAAREWARAAAAVALLLLAGAFAVTGALGQAAATRQAAAAAADKASGDRARAQAAYDDARRELAAVPITRSPQELLAAMAPLSARIGNVDCAGWVPDKSVRSACAARRPLEIELARANRRAELEARMRAADVALSAARTGRPASADATAIAGLLARLGWPVPADAVRDALLLVTVLLVELGGGLCLALAGPVRGTSATVAADLTPAPEPAKPLSPKQTPPDFDAHDRRTLVIEQLRRGALEGRQADLADSLGVPKTTLRRIVASDPRLSLRAMPGGVSRLELVH